MKPIAIPIKDAAKLFGICPATFQKQVDRGILPPALPLDCRSKRWSTDELLNAFDKTKGANVNVKDDLMAAIDGL
jgi:hypothetical protein